MSTIQIVKRTSAKKSGKKQRRRHSIMAFEMIRLDRALDEPLHEQLYRQIRDELASATFNNNSSRLPSSRELGDRPGSIPIHCKRRFFETSFGRLPSVQNRIGHVHRRTVARNFPECADCKSGTTYRTPASPFQSGKRYSGSASRKTVRFRNRRSAGRHVRSRRRSTGRVSNRNMGTTQSRSAGKKGSAFTPVRVKPRRSGPAQGARDLFVRLQRCSLSSRPDHHYRWYAASDDDQRDGSRKSGRGRVDRRPGILSGAPDFWIRGGNRRSKTR